MAKDTFTVGDLRKALEGQPDDRLVVLQRDPEGNGYSEAAGAEEAFYDERNEEVPHSDDYADMDDEDKARFTPCVILWPVR